MDEPEFELDEDTGFQLLGMPWTDDEADLRSRIPFEMLATQFVEELRTGRRPSIELWARRFPRHAAQIREVFPVLAMLENARIDKESESIRRNMPDRFPFSRLGNCELLNEIGRGGMGVVFQARDCSTSQLVAVKILPWRASVVPDWVARFEREAQTAAQLRHRNVVPVYRYGQESGYSYFVMQLVRGLGLDRIIERLGSSPDGLCVDELGVASGLREEHHSTAKRSPHEEMRRLTRSSWRDFAKVAIQATMALRAAHRAGICHNDIKPGNLLLDAEGRIWVTDFGLSQQIDPTVFLQKTNAAVAATTAMRRKVATDRSVSEKTVGGTIRYMAPERFLGHQSASADLYSLGATLYELCLQTPVFDADDRDELMTRILESRPVRPRHICRDIPSGLETIILNCLEKHPVDRYGSADALLADLLRFGRQQSISSTNRRSFGGFFRRLTQRLGKRSSPDPDASASDG